MAFKMIRVNGFMVGLDKNNIVHLQHVRWRNEDGDFVDATVGLDDVRALGEYVLSGKIFDKENRA